MAKVKLVTTVKKSKILQENITDEQLMKGLKPVLSEDGACDKLDPQYMVALVRRKVKLLLPDSATIGLTAQDACKDMWVRCKPWTETQATLDDMDADTFGEDDAASAKPEGAPEVGTANVADTPLETDGLNFVPSDPKISQIPNKTVGETIAMFTDLVINHTVCNLILQDADFQSICTYLASLCIQEVEKDLTRSLVPTSFMRTAFEVLSTLKQLLFLQRIANDDICIETYEKDFADCRTFCALASEPKTE
eukprot:2786711-Pyramimonas_sp.AAC.1